MTEEVERTGGGAALLDASCVRSWLQLTATQVAAERDYLTQLDAAIGDADHGINLDRGLTVAMSKVAALDAATPGRLLRTVGTALISTVGGAAGPLYGTAFVEAGAVLGDDETFDAPTMARALRASLDGIQRRGAASVGDKTMVDALAPALAALEARLDAGRSFAVAVRAANAAAAEGVRATIPLQARKGRASYLGPRSIGHKDPGAASTALMFRTLEQAVTFPSQGQKTPL